MSPPTAQRGLPLRPRMGLPRPPPGLIWDVRLESRSRAADDGYVHPHHEQQGWQPQYVPPPLRPCGHNGAFAWIIVLLVLNLLLTGYVALFVFGMVQSLNDLESVFGG